MTSAQASSLRKASSTSVTLEGLESPQALASLRQQGAARFDAVAWHYIEVLSNKLKAHHGAAHGLLQSKLDKAVQDLQARMAAASSLTPASASDSTLGHALDPTLDLMPRAPSSPLAQLLQVLAAPATPATGMGTGTGTGTGNIGRAENPRIAQFRKTLSQISVQKQVTQAIAQAPHNAGPINSHMLVLRSMGLMRQRAPNYLNRFMGYVDTLLSLQAAGKAKPLIKKPRAAVSAKKPLGAGSRAPPMVSPAAQKPA
jgi:hypothetical protein